MRTFELFHLSLIAKAQSDMFIKQMSREEWLRYVLRTNFQFVHRRREFHWVPKNVDDGDIIGIVERQTAHLHHRPPDEGGTEILGQEWQGAVVIIDPTTHDLGQRVAFERDADVGKPFAILGSMLDHINARSASPYTTEVKPIFDAKDFWEFSKRHKGMVKRITFDFVVPNMWGIKGNLDQELRGTGEDTGAETVKVKLEGADGVKTDSKTIKEAVEYSERGGASVTATALDGDKFNSTDKISSTKITDEEIESGGEQTGVWRRLAGKILRRG